MVEWLLARAEAPLKGDADDSESAPADYHRHQTHSSWQTIADGRCESQSIDKYGTA